ncbi:tRNA-guanine transglycosylase DpdA [Phormidium sp. FACHB-1136]|uniref:tRNA-guanine transglycosylase DpdA n=1 Tax=Phormidium sp. FACHB-1136 TaxID=2692848 RepID=UPI001684370F|nr:tRNA-guanine transglycosylase DpdA [Phormidium sp. FACHB-1136]MBD2425580.1 queuine/archaeosine tRNA-ribosyltransferase [Phormidium sp. FACHB-1136]
MPRPHPRVLVITSCTGEKQFKPEHQLTLDDFRDPTRRRERETELAEYACPAGDLYTGMQHLRLMEGVRALRDAFGPEVLEVEILSAGYGLISEHQKIVPYEVTFNGMKGHEVDAWAEHLGVHQAMEQRLVNADLVFFLLGDNYLRAVQLPIRTNADQTLVFLASGGAAQKMPDLVAHTFVLPLSNQDAKRYRYGLVGLKGFLFKQFAEAAVAQPNLLKQMQTQPELFRQVINQGLETPDQQLALTTLLDAVPTTPKVSRSTAVPRPAKDEFLPIPDVPPAPNRHLGMQYFIPDWDDRVDPTYDFLNDQITPDRDPYTDDVYAHQVYDVPNYDGILVSKVVVDGSQKKRARVEAVGIHDFIRFQGQVMGDCGAFGYIKEDEPPYNTVEILDYYENLGFDFGVSIDHLIVGPFAAPGIREKRYDLTIHNAQDFLEKHRAGSYTFTPIGVAQGWNPETYADAVKENIRIGYDYIALGGLARAQSREIIEIMQAVRPHLMPDTRLHLFGVARINAIPVFRHLGITSFDSASPLRRAWLGSEANYHTLSSKMYPAVRIPPVDGQGVRVKRLIEAGVSDRDTLKDLEQGALKAMRAFDQGTLGLEETLDALLAYDELLELPRDGKVDPAEQAKRRVKHERMYRDLLRDRPWKACDCVICQEVGVEVVIFRGNDRNRRRGFHNTRAFYLRFQELLAKLRDPQP